MNGNESHNISPEVDFFDTGQIVPQQLLEKSMREGWWRAVELWLRMRYRASGHLLMSESEIEEIGREMGLKPRMVRHYLSVGVEKRLISRNQNRRGVYFIHKWKYVRDYHKCNFRVTRWYKEFDFELFIFAASLAVFYNQVEWLKALFNRKPHKRLAGADKCSNKHWGGISIRMMAETLGISHTRSWRLRKRCEDRGLVKVNPRHVDVTHWNWSRWDWENHPDRARFFCRDGRIYERLAYECIPQRMEVYCKFLMQ